MRGRSQIVVLRILLLALGSVLAGCGDDATFSFAGTWSGTTSSTMGFGTTTFTLDLGQSGNTLSGTRTSQGGTSGAMTGTLNGDAVTLTKQNASSVETYNGTRSGSMVSGNYTITDNNVTVDSGTWSMTKQ